MKLVSSPASKTSALWGKVQAKRTQALRAWPWLGLTLATLGMFGLTLIGTLILTQRPANMILGLGLACAALTLLWLLSRRRQAITAYQLKQVESLLGQHPVLTLILTPQGHPVAAYGAAPLALPINSLFQDGLLEAIHAPDRPSVQSALARAHHGAQVQVRFTPRLSLDLRLDLSLRPLTSAAGEPQRLIAVLSDASLQHAREEELNVARAEAEAQSLSKSRVLANVSHELRTPLNAVIGFSDIMVQGLFGPLPARYNGYARSIHEAGGHLLDLIGDLLDVSRIEAERYELSLESFDVREVIAAAMALVRLSAEDKGISLAAVLPSHPVPVTADRRALKQITLNLLSNAVKFTPSGGSVTVAATVIEQDLELVISDTGLGISREDIARLGRPFEQAGDTEQRAQGTGLGLALVRALAELHQGQMSLESTPGSGTAVTVRLPIMATPMIETPSQDVAEIISVNFGRTAS